MTVALAGALVAVGAVNGRGAVSESGESTSVDLKNDFVRWGYAVQGFAASHHRLPCPDTDGDGAENCTGAVVGTMPHVTLELPTAARDGYGRPLRYAASTSLQDAGELEGPSWQPIGRTRDDFCVALRNRVAAGFNAADLSIASPDSSTCDAASASVVAYALVSSGASNADNDAADDPFDGPHSPATPCVMAPSRRKSATYDDTAHSVGVAELAGWICR